LILPEESIIIAVVIQPQTFLENKGKMMKRVFVQFMRPDEIIRERRRTSLIYLPLAPIEWHGPHLPLGVDPVRAELAAGKLAEKTGGVVLPTLFMGTERERSPQMLKNIGFRGDEHIEGMDFPENSLPSLYFREEVFAAVLRNYLEMLVDSWKFKNVVIVNGHGGENHLAVIERLKEEFTAKRKVRIIHIMPMLNFPSHKWSHAAREETETLMAYYLESIRLEKLPDKSVPLYNIKYAIVDDLTFRGRPNKNFSVSREDDPRYSSPEIGRKTFEETVEQLKKIVLKEMIKP
jgi:creatinine amidohydrolase